MRKTATKTRKSVPAKRSSAQKNTRSVAKKAKAKPSAAEGLRSLFINSLKDIYWAEKALTKAIPKMIKNATSDELVDALTEHLEITKIHVERVEEVFSTLGEKAAAKKCEAMEGLIKEGEEIVQETEDGIVRDAGIISATQKIEHYEIASYGTLCAFAKTLGEEEVVGLLQETLNEEKEADEKLSAIAESSINAEAVNASEKEESDDDDEEEEEMEESDDEEEEEEEEE
jgi:ferritin-like metal-binding protein YciE